MILNQRTENRSLTRAAQKRANTHAGAYRIVTVRERRLALALLAILTVPCFAGIPGISKAKSKDQKPAENSALDRYIQEAMRNAPANSGTVSAPGSTWSPSSRLLDLGSDVRARQVHDMVTVLVAESVSAGVTGVTKTSRASAAKAAIPALAGLTKAAGPWANLANLSSNTSLDGEGTTSRQTTFTTTLAARVTHVLPNGYLVVEGAKDIQVNSERQTVIVRGVVRPADLDTANTVRSDHMAEVEVRINGKGAVNDVSRRPNVLYRILMGILPF
jgi:flagellar L-ring protein precursor FlgH